MRKFEKVKRIDTDIKLPERSTRHSAGYDFFAMDDIIIPPVKVKWVQVGIDPYTNEPELEMHTDAKPTTIKTGVKVKMPENEFLMLTNRSSNPLKKNLILANGVGIIDADYYGNPDNDGEMMFPFYNIGPKPVVILKGDKIGQGIFMKFGVTDDDKAWGDRIGGFGSTGN